MVPQVQIKKWPDNLLSPSLLHLPYLLIHAVVDILLWSLSTCRVKLGVRLMCEWMVHFLGGITSKIRAHIPGASDRAAALRMGISRKKVFSLKIYLFLDISYVFFVLNIKYIFLWISTSFWILMCSTFWRYSAENLGFSAEGKAIFAQYAHICLHYCICLKKRKKQNKRSWTQKMSVKTNNAVIGI